MATALANRRVTVDAAVSAFFDRRSRRVAGGRYTTDGSVLRIWGNTVAFWDNGNIVLTNAGWRSVITKQMLNAVLAEAQSRGVTSVRYAIWSERGDWILCDTENRMCVPWTNGMKLTSTGITLARREVWRPYTDLAREIRRAHYRPRAGRPLPPARPAPYTPPTTTPTLFNRRRTRRTGRYQEARAEAWLYGRVAPLGKRRKVKSHRVKILRKKKFRMNLHTAREVAVAMSDLKDKWRRVVNALVSGNKRAYSYWLGYVSAYVQVALEEKSNVSYKVYRTGVKMVQMLREYHRALARGADRQEILRRAASFRDTVLFR